MSNSEIISQIIIPRITKNTGIRVSPIYEKNIEKYVEKAALEKSLPFEEYCDLLVPDTVEFENLINAATTNETYFFREKAHFEFLQKTILPFYRGKELVVWSGACSSGEEPVSLYALLKFWGVKPKIYASDIDSNELDLFKKGVYSKYSFNVDGKEFHKILEETKTGSFENEKFILNQDIFNHITVKQFNLAGKRLPDFFDKADIIFLRNVFIYFDNNLRKEVLNLAAEKLTPGGLIFLSVSEICCIDSDLIPDSMEKVNNGSIYFLMKKDGTKSVLINTIAPKTEFKVPKKIEKKDCCDSIIAPKTVETSVKNTDAKLVFEKVNSLLSQNKFDDALNYLDDYEPHLGEKFYKEYFYALICKESGKMDDAIKHFVLAETINPSFWPAHFNHGMLVKECGKDEFAKRCFEKCLLPLKDYIDSEKKDFDFLMESFSPTYFYELCKKNT